MRTIKRTFAPTLRRLMALVVLAGFLLSLPTAAGASDPLIRPHQFAPKGAPRGSTALGAVPASQPLNLSIVLPPSNSAQLQSLLANLYDPSSPQYHQWLKPGQFGSEFGPSPSTVTSVESWLHGRGLNSTTLSGSSIDVAAPAETVSTALGTSFERYRSSSGARGYVAQDAPLVPQNLAGGQITSIIGLNTVTKYAPEYRSLTPAKGLSSQGSLQPAVSGSCPGIPGSADTLAQVGAAYGIDSLANNGENGQGETIGVYELDPYTASDIGTYLNCAGLSNPVSTVTVDGGEPSPDPAGMGEADLDIQQVATQSPGSSIIAYEGPNNGTSGPFDVWQKIVTDDAAQVISTSWGECEAFAFQTGPNTTVNDPFKGLFMRAATQGQSIFAATGDSGAQDCFTEVGNTPLGLASTVDYPASDPFVTAVGGTTLAPDNSEVVWNNCPPMGSIDCALINGAGGGGVSQVPGTRQNYQPVIDPADQTGSCANTCREVPDISANAGTPMAFLFDGVYNPALGTSFASPLWAGLTADRNVGCTTTTGLFNGALYALNKAGSYGSGGAFNDITTGNNDLTGTSGSGHSDFSALTGYDLASGIGSPIAGGLSCPNVTSVGPGQVGQTVVINGLGLAHATFTFGGTPATIVGTATDKQVSVIVPAGSGTVTVSGSSGVLGSGTITKPFTYPAITTSSLAPGIAGTPYSQTLTAVGVPASKSWTITAGSLPSPLVLNASNGVISGTPPVSGPAQSVTIQVTAGSIVLSAQFSIQVFGASSTTKPTANPPAVDLGSEVTYSATVTSAAGTPNGTVAFSIGSTALCTTLPLVGGTASCQSAAAPAGQDSVTSTYLPTVQSAALSVGTTSLEVSSGPYSPLAPVRICDTRAHDPSQLDTAPAPAAQCNGASNFGSPILGGTSKTIQVSGAFGVPPTATSVVLNLTVVNPVANGFVTAYPTGATLPGTSTINYTAGEVVPNLTDVGIGAGGDISVYSLVQTDLVVDVEGYTSPSADEGAGAGLYTALPSPERLCDTRPGNVSNLTVAPDNQCNGGNQGTTLTGGGTPHIVKVVHGTVIPPQATAAVFNVTVANPTAAGFLTVFPEDQPLPTATSNVNYAAGQVTTNRVIVPLSTTGSPQSLGDISVYSSATADVIVDVSGYYSAAGGTQFNAEAAPVRICDTRPVSSLSPLNQCTSKPVIGGTPLTVNVWGQADVPTTATAVVVNLTGIAPSQPTFLAVFPGTFSGSSDLNPAVGEVRANMAVATINPQTGLIKILNSAGSTDVIVDVLGWYS